MLRFLIILLIFFNPNLGAADSLGHCEVAKKAFYYAQEIRGLPKKMEVQCAVKSKKSVREFLSSAVTERIPKERLEDDEFALKTLGILPKEFGLIDGLINAYTDQLSGYYDPVKNIFVLARWRSAESQMPVAVHELTHALQDQYYNLEEIISELDGGESDELLARSALVEGDATAVMIDYSNKLVGGEPLSKIKNVDSFILQTVIGMSAMGGARGIPEVIKHTMVFPYISGLRFAHHHLVKGGYAELDKIYNAIPKTTEEILHPEKYPSKVGEYEVLEPLPYSTKLCSGSVSRKYLDTLGEFGIVTWLIAHGLPHSKAASIAAGWGGDRLVLYRFDNKSNCKFALNHVTKWDNKNEAKEFENVMNLLVEKIKKANPELSVNFKVKGRNTKLEILSLKYAGVPQN